MKPEPTRPEEASSEADEAKRERATGRLKRLLQAGALRVLGAGIVSLEKLRQRAGGRREQPDEREERGHHPKALPLPETPTEAPPVRRHRLRSVLLILIAVALAGVIGTGISYRLFSKLIHDQAAKIERQQQDITGYQLEEQQQADRIAASMRLLDAEHARRLEAEKRLADAVAAEAEAKAKTEAKATAAAAEPAKGQKAAGKAIAQPLRAPGSSSAFSPSPSSNAFKPPAAKVADCDLVAGDVAALKRCLEDFNRK